MREKKKKKEKEGIFFFLLLNNAQMREKDKIWSFSVHCLPLLSLSFYITICE